MTLTEHYENSGAVTASPSVSKSFDLKSDGSSASLNSMQSDSSAELEVFRQIDSMCHSHSLYTTGMPIDQVPLDEQDELMIEIRAVSNELLELLKDYPQWCDKYMHILQSAPEVIAWAKQYDYKGVRANGYWSMIKMAIKLGRIVIEKYRGVKNPQIDRNLELLLDYAMIALKVLRVLREDSEENDGSLITSSQRQFVELFSLLLSINDEMIAAVYGRYCGFWLCDQARLTSTLVVTLLALGARGLCGDAVRCVIDPEYRGLVLAQLVKGADVQYVKAMGSLMEWRVYKQALPSLLYWNQPVRVKNFSVPRQSRWVLTAQNVPVFELPQRAASVHKRSNNQVRCLLYQNTEGPRPLDTLVVHMHGGGFMIGSPESHDVYIKSWCANIPSCSILSVDYSVAPESKFPVALQQLLDVYLWILSDNQEVEDILGFRPKEIVLAGDSAGGNLTMALLHVIADLNDQLQAQNKPLLLKPKAILNLYSPYNLTLRITPSMILASCDSMISAGVMLSCFEAYLPLVELSAAPTPQTDHYFRSMHSKQIENSEDSRFSSAKSSLDLDCQDCNGQRLDPLDTGFWTDFLQKNNIYSQGVEMLQSVVTNVKSFLKPKEKPQPWYLADKKELEAKVERLKEITSNPYISPLIYDRFDRHKDTKLFMIALHFDPFLDDNVTMAKKWQGSIEMDVFDGLQHGFLNFMPFVDEARKANETCIRRLREAVFC